MEILLSTLPLALGAVLLKLDSTLVLFWDRWTDKPKLKIKIEDKTKILDNRYTFKVSVLNNGRKDAHNCRVSVQVFDQKSGKKIDEYPPLESDLKSGEAKPFPMSGLLAFNDNFVARISAETPKSKVNKIVEYNIINNYGHIMFEKGIVPYLLFHLNKHLLKKYQSEWDTKFLANELKNFSGQNIRKELIEKLGEIGDDKVVKPLIDCLQNDPNEVVRDRAADALGNIGDKRAVDPLLDCLKDGKVDPRWCASAIVKICNQKCDQASVKKLSDLLDRDTTPPYTRGVIAESLGEIREELITENIEGALIDALEDFDGDDLCGVVKALGKVGGEKTLKKLENINDCSNIRKKAIEQIQFRIRRGGDNIEEK
ncbi:MAG: hypothetical protein GWP10_21480 [Nitrospiraceae bacterium]|nr:hypothetical protein [Nitrospiraceae bacterium]